MYVRDKTEPQSSKNTVSVKYCTRVRVCVCARARQDSLSPVRTHFQSNTVCVCASRHSLSPVRKQCQSSPLCVRATQPSLSAVRIQCQSSPVRVRARHDTVSIQSELSVSPALTVFLELTFTVPSSKESRLTEQLLSRLVTIYKPHEHITTHCLSTVCTYKREYYKISAQQEKTRCVSEHASTPIPRLSVISRLLTAAVQMPKGRK
jgi:hypothetical protein